MIPESIMGRIFNSSGIDDRQLVWLDVLSVYLLQHLNETGILKQMCFKGGISLRKVFARTPTRFSGDVDFVDASYEQLSDTGSTVEQCYRRIVEEFDRKVIHGIEWRVTPLKDEELGADGLRMELHFFVYGDTSKEDWQSRTDNVLTLECSFRRPILLPTQLRALRQESWFKHLEFDPMPVPVLQTEEATAEKIRAAFQRNNARDIFDLNDYGQMPFDDELVRKMAVLKCWQDHGLYAGPKNFDPEELLGKLATENYNWGRLKAQVSKHAWIEPAMLVKKLRERFAFLNALTDV
jgi:predicted nucleotidyltransferase component of viral defense system